MKLEMILVADNAEFVGTLPESDTPWSVSQSGNVLIFLNQEHCPMVMFEGKISRMSMAEMRRALKKS